MLTRPEKYSSEFQVKWLLLFLKTYGPPTPRRGFPAHYLLM